MTKKNWFDRLKRFFGSDPKTKQEKERRKRWIFGKFRSKFPPALPAPSLRRLRSLREAEQDQSKHAVAVAIATAAAAEAAVAAAQAAAQVVRLTGTPLSHHRAQEVAAIKIQTAFRGYLARKALQALKGLVKLQALVRGQTVRRQTTITLKGLQSLMNIQTRARASRVQAVKVYRTSEDREIYRRKAILQPSSEKRWDGSSLSKEEINALLRNRREAAIKRERAMEYALYHQEKWNAQRPTTPTLIDKELEYPDVADQRWSWLEQWVGTQPLEKDIPEVFPTQHSDNISKERVEENQLRYLARRSFNRSQKSTARDDDGFSSSPSFPSYMASTASTKARFRSMSTPKQRPGKTDASSDHYSPLHTERVLSPLSSIVSEIGNTGAHYQQRSPLGKGLAGPIKSHRSPNHLSFDSECSLLNWDRRDPFS